MSINYPVPLPEALPLQTRKGELQVEGGRGELEWGGLSRSGRALAHLSKFILLVLKVVGVVMVERGGVGLM